MKLKNKKLNKLVFYVSLSALVLFGLSYSQGVVKAEVVMENMVLDNGVFHIPYYDGDALFICHSAYGNGFSFTLDGVGGKVLTERMPAGYDGQLRVKYVENPRQNATLSASGDLWSASCYLISNLAKNSNGEYYDIVEEKEQLNSLKENNYITLGEYYNKNHILFISYKVGYYGGAIELNDAIYLGGSSSANSQFNTAYQLNGLDAYKNTDPSTTSYITASVVEFFTGGGGGGLSITSQYYNPSTRKLYLSGTCEKYGSGINQLTLYADSYPDPNGVWNGGLVSCLNGNIWSAIYTDIEGNMTGDHTIYIYDPFVEFFGEGTYLSSIDQDFGEYYYGEETNWDELGIFVFQDSYNCSQNATCIIKYDYNENYIPEDTNEMRLYDPDEILVATSTIESFSELGKANGKSRITVEIASTTPIGKYVYVVEADQNGNSLWQYGRPITINVFDGSIPNAAYVWDSDEDISTLWGDSYTLACSEEEWAEADDSNFFNMIRLKCNATKTTLDIFFGTLNVAKSVFSNVYESGKTLLKNTFPFNMIYKVKYQWDRSAYINLPVDLALIQNATESGELSVKIKKELLSSEEDVYWVLWGDDIWEENTEVKKFFDFIRVLSKYFMYALFLLGVYKMGEDFFNEYMYENKLSSQRNSDWQYDQFKD